jgi:hypothetical protein
VFLVFFTRHCRRFDRAWTHRRHPAIFGGAYSRCPKLVRFAENGLKAEKNATSAEISGCASRLSRRGFPARRRIFRQPATPEKAGILPEAAASARSRTMASIQASGSPVSPGNTTRCHYYLHFQDGVVPAQAVVARGARPYILSIATLPGVRHVRNSTRQ